MSGLERITAANELKPVITHDLEAVRGPDGGYLHVYNYYDYTFGDLPDAEAVRARVHFGERTVALTGLSPRRSPKSTEKLIDYFRSRMFEEIECLSPDNSENDQIKGYQIIWSADDRN
jgi:hypothetical protein